MGVIEAGNYWVFSPVVVHYDENGEKSESLESVIRKWRKSQKIKTICAEIPKDQFDSVCEYLKKLGCKIIL